MHKILTIYKSNFDLNTLNIEACEDFRRANHVDFKNDPVLFDKKEREETLLKAKSIFFDENPSILLK